MGEGDEEKTESSRLCSDHFEKECFEQNLDVRKNLGSPFKPRRITLKRDVAIPTIFNFEKKK
jgi:hypothetical protein